MEKGLTKNQIIQELTRSTHGALEKYVPVGKQAASKEPEFFAHLIAWNDKKGQVRDSKVALPVIHLSAGDGKVMEFTENSFAHLAKLDPRNLCKALEFAYSLKVAGHGRAIRRLIEAYLRAREANWSWWERTTVQHRASMKSLYARQHIKPSAMAEQILFKNDPLHGTVFHDIAHLKDMAPLEAAGTIINRKIPFLVAVGALGSKLKDEALVLALIERMSPTEVVTNTAMLEKLGVKERPALRAAFEQALSRAAVSKKQTFKTTRAAEAVKDEGLKSKLSSLQEKQIATMGGVDGDWLVLGDRSPSMQLCIEAAKMVAATLARMVKGQVHLIFFDSSPLYFDVSGKSYEEILGLTRHVVTGAATSIGVGLQYIMEKKIEVGGIAIVSDACENTAPYFAERYMRYVATTGGEPPVYLYRFEPGIRASGDRDLKLTMESQGLELQEFDLRHGVDYHSLPNLVKTMRTSRYSLVDEVMQTPLLTLQDVLKDKAEDVVSV